MISTNYETMVKTDFCIFHKVRLSNSKVVKENYDCLVNDLPKSIIERALIRGFTKHANITKIQIPLKNKIPFGVALIKLENKNDIKKFIKRVDNSSFNKVKVVRCSLFQKKKYLELHAETSNLPLDMLRSELHPFVYGSYSLTLKRGTFSTRGFYYLTFKRSSDANITLMKLSERKTRFLDQALTVTLLQRLPKI